MTDNITCLRCGGDTQLGSIPEYGHLNEKRRLVWYEGKPKLDPLFGLQFDNGEKYYVRSYRCVKCGHIEFFAGPSQVGASE